MHSLLDGTILEDSSAAFAIPLLGPIIHLAEKYVEAMRMTFGQAGDNKLLVLEFAVFQRSGDASDVRHTGKVSADQRTARYSDGPAVLQRDRSTDAFPLAWQTPAATLTRASQTGINVRLSMPPSCFF